MFYSQSDEVTRVNVRRIVIICLAAATLASVSLFYLRGGRVKNNVAMKVGVFIYRGDDTFISNMMNSLRDIVGKFERENGVNFNFSYMDAQGSQTTQNMQIDRCISLGYNVLCVNLVDRTSAAYVIDKAMEAGVPVIFFNREPVQADMRKWGKLFYVGTDAVMNGRMEAQIIVDAYNADPASLDFNGDGIIQYIMIEGEFRHQDAILRTEGSVQTLLDAGLKVEKLDGGVANWVRTQAAALARDYFTKYGDQIELIICNNDDMALGVLDYVAENGLDFYNVVGIDGTPQGLAAVREGRMLGTVLINYEGQAELIFQLTYATLTGANPHDIMDIPEDRCLRAPLDVVTRERS